MYDNDHVTEVHTVRVDFFMRRIFHEMVQEMIFMLLFSRNLNPRCLQGVQGDRNSTYEYNFTNIFLRNHYFRELFL